MEGVEEDRWTQVHMTKKGRPVRIDFTLLASDPPWRRMWRQEIEGTPFERVLGEAVTEIGLDPHGDGTTVTIEQRQKLRWLFPHRRLPPRRATGDKLDPGAGGDRARLRRAEAPVSGG